MSEIVDITVISSPVTVEVTAAAAAPVTVSVGAQAAVTASLTVTAAAVTAAAEIQSDVVTVEVTEAQPGADGASFTPVILNTLADYLALPPAQQIDPTKIYGVRVQS